MSNGREIDNGRDSSRVVFARRCYAIARQLLRLGAQQDTLNLEASKIDADPPEPICPEELSCVARQPQDCIDDDAGRTLDETPNDIEVDPELRSKQRQNE